MSRSFRKTPIVGNTTSPSDKPFKEQEHRRERRAAKASLLAGDEPIAKDPRLGNPYNTPKDGKRYRADISAKDMRK